MCNHKSCLSLLLHVCIHLSYIHREEHQTDESLYLSPSLHSSSCLPLYLNILFSMCMCLSVVWECVFDSEKKRESVQVQGNSWYQRVESLSLFLSLSLSFSVYLSRFSLSEIRVVHWTLCWIRNNLVSRCLLSDFEIRWHQVNMCAIYFRWTCAQYISYIAHMFIWFQYKALSVVNLCSFSSVIYSRTVRFLLPFWFFFAA